MITRPFRTIATAVLTFTLLSMNMNSHAYNEFVQTSNQENLKVEDVQIATQSQGKFKSVVGSIVINQPAERIWPIVVNPYEFQRSIFPRMKRIELLRDEPDLTLMKVGVDCGIFPKISYVVECRYVRNERIDFKRVEGTPKSFDGSWQIEPLDNGSRSRVTYSLFVDPGILLPQWFVREALKVELPRTLRALRHRVNEVYQSGHLALKRSILAAGMI